MHRNSRVSINVMGLIVGVVNHYNNLKINISITYLDLDRVWDDLRDPDPTIPPSIPMSGSTAAETRLWVSFTLDMASSISRWTASELLAWGLEMA